jgi:asparagine synthase (glutamine-hydrolysing)
MCGIIGSIGNINLQTSQILGSIDHRGPDSQGFFQKDDVFLGHTRLSIQDLSENGNQPMFSADGEYAIIFNGEVYNHQEIRQQYLADIQFRSSGDTETVLYAFIRYREKCVNMFNGIFAFAIYEVAKKNIFIARDHFGIKPLYLYNDKKQFIFGSEIKSFLQFDIDRSINVPSLVNYLAFLWSPGTATPFQKVTRLLPGHYLSFKTDAFDNIQSVPFYKTEFDGKYWKLTEEALIDELDNLLTKAVERQLLSDVPVGFFLSGGLDSTLLVAIAKKLHPEIKFPCYTIDVASWKDGKEAFTEDIVYARKAAEFLDVELFEVKADLDILQNFDKMIWHLDEPQADAAPLNVYNIALLAKQQNIKVLIGGAAGDDIFSGYRRHIALRYEMVFEKIPFVIKKAIKFFCGFLPSGVPAFRKIKKVTDNLPQKQSERMIGYFDWMSVKTIKKLFTPKIQQQIAGFDPHAWFHDLLKQIPEEKDLLQQMLFLEQKTFMVDHNLNYTDKMAMATGVEARVPYLDTELVAFAQRIPPAFKLKGNETKYILKKLAERYLPKEIIYRPKTGFGAPVRKWITEDMSGLIEERLSKERVDKQGIFDHEKIWQLIEANKTGKIDASYSIWAILAIESWVLQFVKTNQ